MLLQLIEKLIEQFYLVGVSLLFAIVMGIPLGILITRKQRLRTLVLSATNILQTIPSLALLAFLLPFFGIGMKPAIITLAFYTLLPIIRNTVVGLETIPSANIEAANGLGLTDWQRLRIIELPLAWPTIITGIRIASAMSVGVATLAAFVGAGGLGDFINQGLALNNPHLLLWGAIPAALLALLLDGLLGQIKTISKTKIYVVLGLLSVLLGFMFVHQQPKETIRIATKNFTEQLILGEIFSQLIEAKTNLKVKRYFNLGTTEICHQALLNNQIDLYPEYSGTAYLTVLHLPYVQLTPSDLFAKVKKAYSQQFHLQWLSPLGFNNSQAVAVEETFAQKNHLINISDLKLIEEKLRIGASPEFILRPDALPGLEKIYDLHFSSVKQFDPSLAYSAMLHKHVNVMMVFSTDGRIQKYHLHLLHDDAHLFPAYDAAPIIRQAMLDEHPELFSVLNLLAGKLDAKTMRELNYQVDVQKRAPAEVAYQFLQNQKLLTYSN